MGNCYAIAHELYKLIQQSLLGDISIFELPFFWPWILEFGVRSETTLSTPELHFLVTKNTLWEQSGLAAMELLQSCTKPSQ